MLEFTDEMWYLSMRSLDDIFTYPPLLIGGRKHHVAWQFDSSKYSSNGGADFVVPSTFSYGLSEQLVSIIHTTFRLSN